MTFVVFVFRDLFIYLLLCVLCYFLCFWEWGASVFVLVEMKLMKRISTTGGWAVRSVERAHSGQ